MWNINVFRTHTVIQWIMVFFVPTLLWKQTFLWIFELKCYVSNYVQTSHTSQLHQSRYCRFMLGMKRQKSEDKDELRISRDEYERRESPTNIITCRPKSPVDVRRTVPYPEVPTYIRVSRWSLVKTIIILGGLGWWDTASFFSVQLYQC